MRKRPLLQVALDLTDIESALKIATKSIRGGADILEIGTPLVKSFGIKAVSIFKAIYSDKIIVADLKTFDTGELESTIAFEAGADISTVMGLADYTTIEGAIKAANKYSKKIMVDFMNINDPVKKLYEIIDLRPHVICLHVGIDVQVKRKMSAINLAEEVLKIKKTFSKVKVAVAGGINKDSARIFKNADIVIVGGAITKSIDPERSTKEIISALEQ